MAVNQNGGIVWETRHGWGKEMDLTGDIPFIIPS